MTKKCRECKSEENVRKLTVPINTRKGRVLKTKKIWVCKPCIQEKYPDYRTIHPTIQVRGVNVNTKPRD